MVRCIVLGMPSRIKIGDKIQETISKMSGGNPGAITALAEVIKANATIDTISAFGPLSTVITLDSLGIFDENIWILYKDVCQESAYNLILVCRAFQLGFVTPQALYNLTEDDIEGLEPRIIAELQGKFLTKEQWQSMQE